MAQHTRVFYQKKKYPATRNYERFASQHWPNSSDSVEVRAATMDADGFSSALAIRSSAGIEVWRSSGARQPYEPKAGLPREETKNSRSISFSPDGRYFAFTNGSEIKVLKTSDWQLQCTMPRPKAFYLKFSPRGNYLCVWELFCVTKDKPNGAPNMFVYETSSGAEMLSVVQKKQTDWEPSWSADETLFALMVDCEAHFYDLPEGSVDGFKKPAHRLVGYRNGALSLSPGHSPPYLAMYTPGTKGGPSMCKLYKYPAIDKNQTLACKSFFQADRVDILWNKRGTGLLLLTSTEVDKSGASYYGNQAVHFMATRGDTCSVPLSKEGPVHCVKWSPKATEFVVVYGFMPAKATIYNLKCDVIFDFGEAPRNCAHFNGFGNLLMFGGFGNLPGNVEIWDVDKRERIANIKCPDTTLFEWRPDGAYFVTATTAPRLRISNGFKIYHYSGALMHETLWPQGQELLGVEWQKFPADHFKAPAITKAKQEGIKSSQPEASIKAYTPPHLRNNQDTKNIPQPTQSKKSTTQLSPGAKLLASIDAAANIPPLAGGNDDNNTTTTTTTNNTKKNKNNNNNNNNNNNTNNHSNNNNNTNSNNVKQNARNKQQQQQQQQQTNEEVNNEETAATAAVDGTKKKKRSNRNKLLSENLVEGDGAAASDGAAGAVPPPANGEVGASRRLRKMNRAAKFQQEEKDNSKQQNDDAGVVEVPAGASNNNTNTNNTNNVENSEAKETEKRIRNVAKKLNDIKKLKNRRDNGESLEINQLNKISKEADLLKALRSLKVSNATPIIPLENPAN